MTTPNLFLTLLGCSSEQLNPFFEESQNTSQEESPSILDYDDSLDYPQQFAVYDAYKADFGDLSSEIAIIDITKQDGVTNQLNKLWSISGQDLTRDGQSFIQAKDDPYELFSPKIAIDQKHMHAVLFMDLPVSGLPINDGNLITINKSGEIISECQMGYTHHSYALDEDGFAYYPQTYLVKPEDFEMPWLNESLYNQNCSQPKYVLFDRIVKMNLETCETQTFLDTFDYFTPHQQPDADETQCTIIEDVFDVTETLDVRVVDFTHINHVGIAKKGSDGEASLTINSPYLNAFLEFDLQSAELKLALLGRGADHRQSLLQNSNAYLQNEFPILKDSTLQNQSDANSGFEHAHGPHLIGSQLYMLSNGNPSVQNDKTRPLIFDLKNLYQGTYANRIEMGIEPLNFGTSLFLGGVAAQQENLDSANPTHKLLVNHGMSGVSVLYNIHNNEVEWYVETELNNPTEEYSVYNTPILYGNEVIEFLK